MKASTKLILCCLLTTTFAALATLTGQANVLADVRQDYLPAASFPLSDTNGNGTWEYYASAFGNVNSKTALTWYASPSTGEAAPYYGGTDTQYNLPGLNDSQLFSDGALAASNQVAWHPGLSYNTDLQWTAGTGETGLLTLSGIFSRIGEDSPQPGTGLVDFTIYINGVSVFNPTFIAGGSSDPFLLTFNSTVGTTVDFVLSHSVGQQYFRDESLLSASITNAVPEPSTWALMLSAGIVLVVWKKKRLKS